MGSAQKQKPAEPDRLAAHFGAKCINQFAFANRAMESNRKTSTPGARAPKALKDLAEKHVPDTTKQHGCLSKVELRKTVIW
jgi:hypothetical protein